MALLILIDSILAFSFVFFLGNEADHNLGVTRRNAGHLFQTQQANRLRPLNFPVGLGILGYRYSTIISPFMIIQCPGNVQT